MGQEQSNEKKFDSLACLLPDFYSFEKSGSLNGTEKKTSTLRVMLWEQAVARGVVHNATELLALLPRLRFWWLYSYVGKSLG